MDKTVRAALNRILDLDSNLVASSRHCSYLHQRQLLYAVVWNKLCSYADLIQAYVLYNKKTFSKLLCHCCLCWIRFSEAHYQVIEQSRRASKVTSADSALSPLNNTSTTQEEVIDNGHNKTSRIALVSEEADSDNLIISTALEYSHVDPGVDGCKDMIYDIS